MNDTLPRALGWASIGLGVPQVMATRTVARATGVDGSALARAVIRTAGVRELGQGAALLAGPPQAVWARVAGDALDMAAIGRAMASREGSRRRRLALTAAAVAAITAVDVYAAVRTRSGPGDGRGAGRMGALRLRASVTIDRTPETVYAHWRRFESLPTFLRHVREVHPLGDGRWHWEATAPLRRTVAWDAEVTADEPGRRISWRSVGGDVNTTGTVWFAPAPGDRGTEVRVVMDYDLPGGPLGTAVAKLFGEAPQQQVSDDLRRFKQVVETGRVVRSDALPHGAETRRQLFHRPARPVGPADGGEQP